MCNNREYLPRILNYFPCFQVIDEGNEKQKIFTYDAIYNNTHGHTEDSYREEDMVYQSTVR